MKTPQLSEPEEKALEGLANNSSMFSAIEKVFRQEISLPADFNLSKDNEDLGADLRASIKASQLLENGLNEIRRFGKGKRDKNKGNNPAV